MMERNGPGEMKTESRSPIIASGVATPKHARTSMTTVIAMPATSPASKPAESAFVLLISDYRSYKLCSTKEPNCEGGSSSPFVRLRRDSSRGELDVKFGGKAAFI